MKALETKHYPFLNPDLHINDRLDDLISRLSLDEKIGLMPTNQNAVERLTIREFVFGGEASHGLAWLGVATTFPQPIGLSCTWNPKLLYKVGETIGKEARIYYKKLKHKQGLTLWAPIVDLGRDPRWGRTEESYGEDPYLTSTLARSFVDGMQGNHPFYKRVVSTIKHYIGNNNEHHRLESSSNIDNRNKYEYYTKPFKYLIKNEGAYSVMPAYNCINGLPCILDPDLNDLIKKEWGLTGYIVGDAGDMKMNVDNHNFCSSYEDSIAQVIRNGVDSINDEADLVIESITGALSQGLLVESDIDQALRRTMKARFQLGEFDPPELNPFAEVEENALCCAEHSNLSLEASLQSIVLLKNDEFLPLRKDSFSSLAVIGPLANSLFKDWYSGDFPYKVPPLTGIENKLGEFKVKYENGSDKIALRSKKNGKFLKVRSSGDINANGSDIDETVIFEVTDWGYEKQVLRSLVNGKYISSSRSSITASSDEPWGWFVTEVFNIKYTEGNYAKIYNWNGQMLYIDDELNVQFKSEETENENHELFEVVVLSDGIKEAEKIAKASDTVIVFIGNHPLINGKEDQDRPNISLPSKQEELVRTIYAVNPNVVVCVIGSYPFAITEIDREVPAIVYSAHGGQETGNAIADVLFGDYSPSGRLSMTWYRDVEQLPDILEYDIIKAQSTYLYYQGEVLYPFGHGLSYTRFRYDCLKIKVVDQNIEVVVNIENIGEEPSDEVVQVYVDLSNPQRLRPTKQLIAYKRISLIPSDKITVDFSVPVDDLSFWDVSREKYCIESSDYLIMVGSSSKDIKLTQTVYIQGEDIPPRDIRNITKAENYDSYHNVILTKTIDGNQYIKALSDSSWIMFNNVQMSGCELLEFQYMSLQGEGYIELRLNSHSSEILLTKILLKNTSTWETISHSIGNIASEKQLYIVLSEGVCINWFCCK